MACVVEELMVVVVVVVVVVLGMTMVLALALALALAVALCVATLGLGGATSILPKALTVRCLRTHFASAPCTRRRLFQRFTVFSPCVATTSRVDFSLYDNGGGTKHTVVVIAMHASKRQKQEHKHTQEGRKKETKRNETKRKETKRN